MNKQGNGRAHAKKGYIVLGQDNTGTRAKMVRSRRGNGFLARALFEQAPMVIQGRFNMFQPQAAAEAKCCHFSSFDSNCAFRCRLPC